MKILINIGITLLIVLVGFYILVFYVPLGALESNNNIGTSVTTILGTDTISGSRTTINNNFTALNNGKVEVSTTSMTQLTGIGTITTGTWNATAIAVNKGGTGTTTPTANMVMIGNGASGFKVIGTGVSAQALISNGSGSDPSWQSVITDQTQAYNWTNLHTFGLGMIVTASSTLTATTTFNGWITSNNASTTVYGDLKVMGNISGTTYYGGRQKCVGHLSINAATGNGTQAVTCGFAPQVILFTAQAPADQQSSIGWSDGVNNYSHGIWNNGGTYTGTSSSVYAVSVELTSGSLYYLYGTTTINSTGFVFNYVTYNNGTTYVKLIDYIAF